VSTSEASFDLGVEFAQETWIRPWREGEGCKSACLSVPYEKKRIRAKVHCKEKNINAALGASFSKLLSYVFVLFLSWYDLLFLDCSAAQYIEEIRLSC